MINEVELNEIALKTIEEELFNWGLDEQNNNFAECTYGILTLNEKLKEYLSSEYLLSKKEN